MLSFGGILDIGDKLFAVPWQAFKLNTETHQFILDVPKERLQNAPGFDKSDWPDMAQPEFENMIHGYYGTKGPGEMPKASGM